ncbi:hypothetical protein BN873_340077 [Candidatus Competibacter denitrificans Run_A_D11]|uniref:Response regulator receiver modulated diguanylate cyclase/phosphodiesterase with PAS/PAC sensor(S) n=1 Tax=Candidatus Competibacter denitrificans Run_A_D11 TaxID=1400863 RepID=W6M4E0_9GAMM|nr:EAL domain-containing protein [Candidatus Competibacter denitrificans]CDI02701.1 hypothetical protein BN873_340077 [Candidatus Competibacter denitrificans Run_A_D11]HAS86329.1 GGDEF domain-containing response regulator [Candidatus Competibacteraceae bacterium]HRC69946.1 EAL domain-containing protein [Candidatus Competibacter denitrificans]
MSEPSVINLLVVDRAKADIEHIVKTLRGNDYQVELTEADAGEAARNAIDYQPLDLVLLRVAEGLPTVAEIRLMVAESGQAIPLIALVDESAQQQHKPAHLLFEGADNVAPLADADHLLAVIRKELEQARLRRIGESFETRFKESENRTKALLENTQEAIAYIHEGLHAYANPAYLRLFGYEGKEDLANIQLLHMVPPTYRDALKSVLRRSIRSGKAIEPVELLGVRSNGTMFPIFLECAPTRMNDEPCTQIIVRDATPDKQAHNQQLEDLLKYDEVTGLYSRRFFLETLEIGHDGSLLYVLLADYATVRYNMGFEAVEQFAREAANLIKGLLSSEDIAAHFASGVFTIYMPAKSPADPKDLAERICATVAAHTFQILGKMFSTTCSIGIYKARSGEETTIQILSHADRACEAARQKGGNQVEIYVPPPSDKKGSVSPQDEAIIRMIREALTKKGHLSLLYQPIVSFETAEEARYKAYLQITDEEGGNLQPMDKVGAVAARYGAMGALDKWTIIRGLSVLMETQQAGTKPPILFLRISYNSILDKEFFDWLSKRVKESRLSGHHLVLEIKEDNAEEYFEEAKALRTRLRELGCGIALSHFGGKQNSERLLKEMLPDFIKLDGSLIEKLAKARDEQSRRSMATLAGQAQELNVRVVAAGVSTAPQMASIWQFGVTLVQGNMVAEAGAELDFDFKQYAS